MDLDELLGIDRSDPEQVLAIDLADGHRQMMDALVALRRSHGLRQKDVAARMGISQSAVARIESGERDLHLSTLRRYALAIGARITHHVVDDRSIHGE